MTEAEYMRVIERTQNALENGLICIEEFLNKMVELAIQFRNEKES